MEGQRDLHATIDTHYIPYPPTIYTTLAGYGIAERDGERCESGRRTCLRMTVLRIGTTCETVRIGTPCVLADRDDERYGADLDGVRTRAGREVVRYELTTIYERDALRAVRRTN